MSEPKKCPICDGELENGFLVTPRPLWWDKQKHLLVADGEKVEPFKWSINNIEAYRCPKCNLIMFKYVPQVKG